MVNCFPGSHPTPGGGGGCPFDNFQPFPALVTCSPDSPPICHEFQVDSYQGEQCWKPALLCVCLPTYIRQDLRDGYRSCLGGVLSLVAKYTKVDCVLFVDDKPTAKSLPWTAKFCIFTLIIACAGLVLWTVVGRWQQVAAAAWRWLIPPSSHRLN